MKFLQNILLSLQKLILPKQKLINRLLLCAEIVLMLFWLAMVALTVQSPLILLRIGELGSNLGTVSLILFCLTLLPGIITRLQILPQLTLPIATMITPFRRHLGISMFLTAFVHMSLSSTLPHIALTLLTIRSVLPMTLDQKLPIILASLPPPFRLFEQVSIIGWLLLLPVWLTSNDFSQKRLGKWWKRVQRLTYLAIWFIMAHLALQGAGWALAVGVFAVLEITSWVVFWYRKRLSKRAASTLQ